LTLFGKNGNTNGECVFYQRPSKADTGLVCAECKDTINVAEPNCV